MNDKLNYFLFTISHILKQNTFHSYIKIIILSFILQLLLFYLFVILIWLSVFLFLLELSILILLFLIQP